MNESKWIKEHDLSHVCIYFNQGGNSGYILPDSFSRAFYELLASINSRYICENVMDELKFLIL